jgi:predicted lipid-binding transport protein (Tim44 family)
MSRTRRTALVLLLGLALALLLAPAALAAAGGGSSGYGGGGGGGRGAGLYILIQILIRIAIFGHGLGILILVGLAVLAVLYANFAPKAQGFWTARERSGHGARRRTAARRRRVELAAAEAAEDDPAFAPDMVRAAAATLFTQVQEAWDAADRARLRTLVAPGLLAEWERRLDDFERRGWRNRVAALGDPHVEYVGLSRRRNAVGDRAVVRIEGKLRDYVEDRYGNHLKRVGRLSQTVRVREFWTLGRQRGRWVLLSIEQGAEGAHALHEEIVSTPWSDERALRDEALVEGAVADAVPAGTSIAELADLDFEGDARAAALDLSLADGRFAPAVLEVAARRAVAAWAEAVDGEDQALLAIADPLVARELLHPGDPTGSTRLVVRGPEVQQIRIVALNAGATPPTMTVEVDLTGRRYIEHRDTAAVLAGSQTRKSAFTERWTLALDADPRQPWRIMAIDAPVESA